MNLKELQKTTQRDASIDVLRWIALTGIILVHIQPSPFWSQLRSFDVPMMVFLSAYCFARSYHGPNNYKGYCFKRFNRLVIPCWIFLIGWFTLYNGVLSHPIDWKNIFLCFSLLTPWYLWIIRVFFLMALIAPFIIKPLQTFSVRTFFIVMTAGFIVNEMLCHISTSYAYVVVLMTFSYLLVFAYGVYIHKLSNKQILTIGGGTMLIFISIAIALYYTHGGFILVGKYKYPPHLYYLSYAIACISFLWVIRSKIVHCLHNIRLLNIITYIGSHTMWIYLWHIPILSLVSSKFNASIRFAIVYVCAVMLVVLQTSLVKRLGNRIHDERKRKDLLSILIG